MSLEELIAIAKEKFSIEVDTQEDFFNTESRILLKTPLNNRYVLLDKLTINFDVEFFKSDRKPDDLFDDYDDFSIRFNIYSIFEAKALFNFYKV